MNRALDGFRADGGVVLMAIASEVEWRAVARGFEADTVGSGELWRPQRLGEGTLAVLTGVSKSNAAGGVAAALSGDGAPGRVLVVSVGIAGALPALDARTHTSGEGSAGPMAVGEVVAGSVSVFADEGMQEPAGWSSMATLGFAIAGGEDGIEASPAAVAAVERVVDRVAPIATVSTCSGTDALAMDVARRTGAAAEAMEGAAAGLAAQRLGHDFLEVRVISNMTGDRDRQGWSLGAAMERLESLARAL